MEKFRTLFQHFQSSPDSVMNGVCLLLAVVTIKLYSSFDFSCPCLACYNTLYGLGLLLTPPLALFLCGLLANRQSVVMMEEWRRPAGHRRKEPSIIRYMCSSVLQRALAAPLVWVLLALLDGKCFVCAFSSSVDPEKFLDFANMTSSQVQLFLAKVPCKEDELVRNSPARKAVSRYLRCLSQAIGWSITLLLIVLTFLARCLRPCFDQTVFLQRRYWGNYVDLEQKLFDETCCEHAHRCVLHFFASMQSGLQAWGLQRDAAGRGAKPPEMPEPPRGSGRKWEDPPVRSLQQGASGSSPEHLVLQQTATRPRCIPCARGWPQSPCPNSAPPNLVPGCPRTLRCRTPYSVPT